MTTSTRIAVQQELLDWAIARSGLSLDDVRIGSAKIDEWLSGVSHPTLKQLETLSRKLMVPLGYLTLMAPPQESLPVPDFRTKNDKPLPRISPNLIDTILTMTERQDWLRETLAEDGQPPLDFVGSVSIKRPVADAAQKMRTRLGLSETWTQLAGNTEDAVRKLRNAAEAVGVYVFLNGVVGTNTHRTLDPEEFRGFVLCDNVAPVVFLNNNDSASAKLFTLAHELAHVWLGQGAVFNLEQLLPSKQTTERYCNQVAAELLVPGRRYRAVWSAERPEHDAIKIAARVFKVSNLVSARRALDLGLVQKQTFFAFLQNDRENWLRQKSAKQSGGDFRITQRSRLGLRFSQDVIRAVREGRLLYRDAAQLTQMNGKTFERYTAEILGVAGHPND